MKAASNFDVLYFVGVLIVIGFVLGLCTGILILDSKIEKRERFSCHGLLLEDCGSRYLTDYNIIFQKQGVSETVFNDCIGTLRQWREAYQNCIEVLNDSPAFNIRSVSDFNSSIKWNDCNGFGYIDLYDGTKHCEDYFIEDYFISDLNIKSNPIFSNSVVYFNYNNKMDFNIVIERKYYCNGQGQIQIVTNGYVIDIIDKNRICKEPEKEVLK